MADFVNTRVHMTAEKDMACLFNARAWFGSYEGGSSGAAAANRKQAQAQLEIVLSKTRKQLAHKHAAADAIRTELSAKAHALTALAQSRQHQSVRIASLKRSIVPLRNALRRAMMDVGKLEKALQMLEQRHVLMTQSSLQQEVVGVLDTTNSYVALGDAQYDADAITEVIADAGVAHTAAVDREHETDEAFSNALDGTSVGEDARYAAFTQQTNNIAATQGIDDTDAFLADLGAMLGEDFVPAAAEPRPHYRSSAEYYAPPSTYPATSDVDPHANPAASHNRGNGPDESSTALMADW